MPTPFEFLLLSLAAARVTVLLIDDTILDEPRGAVHARLLGHPALLTLVTCAWCLGFWVALLWTVAFALWPGVTAALALPWAVAMLAWWTGAWWLPEDSDDDE